MYVFRGSCPKLNHIFSFLAWESASSCSNRMLSLAPYASAPSSMASMRGRRRFTSVVREAFIPGSLLQLNWNLIVLYCITLNLSYRYNAKRMVITDKIITDLKTPAERGCRLCMDLFQGTHRSLSATMRHASKRRHSRARYTCCETTRMFAGHLRSAFSMMVELSRRWRMKRILLDVMVRRL